MILQQDLQEASGGLIAVLPLAADGPRRLNASNHLSDLIWRRMNQAVLINADLDGWRDSWTPFSPPHQHQYLQRWRRLAGILLHTDALQSANGWLAERKEEDCQISELCCRNKGCNLSTQPALFRSKQPENDRNQEKTQLLLSDSLHRAVVTIVQSVSVHIYFNSCTRTVLEKGVMTFVVSCNTDVCLIWLEKKLHDQ